MGAVLGMIAAVGIGLSELYGRRIVAVSSAITAAWLLQGFGIVTALASLLLVDGEPIGADLGWGLVSGLGMASGLGFYFFALTRSSSTVVAPTVATLSAVIPYTYSLLRGEQATTLAIAGAGLAFVGLAVIAAGSAEVNRLRAGLLWGIVSGLSYGFGISVFVEASDASGVWPAVTQRLSAALILAVVAVRAGSAILPPPGVRWAAVGAGVFGGITSVALVLGLRIHAPSTIVTSSMFPMVSVVLGYIYFADPVARRQAGGIVAALAGIALVVGA